MNKRGVTTFRILATWTTLAATALIGSCGSPYSSNSSASTSGLAISPAGSVTILPSASQTFSASGGSGTGYVYTVSGSCGTIVASTGVFTAYSTTGSCSVIVTDSAGATSTSTVIVSTTTNTTVTITVTPASGTIAANASETFVASGGTAPYTYKIYSGGGTIDASTGIFIAPNVAGTTTIQAIDAAGYSGFGSATVSAAAQPPGCTGYTIYFDTYTFDQGCPVSGQKLSSGQGSCVSGAMPVDQRDPNDSTKWLVKCSTEGVWNKVVLSCCTN